MTASSKIGICFKRAMIKYGLKGRKTFMDINHKISNEQKTNVMIGVITNIITNIIWMVIILPVFALVFGGLLSCETSDTQPSSLSSTWEIVEVSTVEREVFSSEESTRRESRYIYWERSSYIQVERRVRCVSVRNSADGFHLDAVSPCEEISLDHRYRNGDLPDHFSGLGR